MPALLPAVITVGIDPTITVGPLVLAWHGIFTAVGLVVGGGLALFLASRRGHDSDVLLNIFPFAVIAGMAGAKLLFLLEHDPAEILRPVGWLESNGWSIYGAVIAGAGVFLWRIRKVDARGSYLDIVATGFVAGLAVGRIGDVINGEHFGSVSDLPWAVRNSHPAASVPSTEVAYHSGGLYEVVLGLILLVVALGLARRLRPGSIFWIMAAGYAIGRFIMFFTREDSPDAVLGLTSSHLISLAILFIAVAALVTMHRRMSLGQAK